MENPSPTIRPNLLKKSPNNNTSAEKVQEADKPLRVGVLRAHKKALPMKSALNLMAYMAKNFNIELYFFTPRDINFENKTVKAIFTEGSKRTTKVIPLPKIIDNDPELFNGVPGINLKNKLKNYCYCIRPKQNLSKQKVYDILFADGRFKELLIETHEIKNFEHFLSLLEQYNNDVVMKPIGGTEGRNIFRIARDDKKYIITPGKEATFSLTDAEIKKFYDENFTQRKQVLQPYIVSRTKDGNPFDIRIHARRGKGGKFELFPYPRLGNINGILSNISAGGYSIPIKNFLKNEFGNDWKTLYDQLINLGNTLPNYFQSFFKQKILAIGIDVGIQRCGDSYELKIFEVNHNNPGTRVIQIEAAFSLLEYLQYLGKCLAKGTLEKNL